MASLCSRASSPASINPIKNHKKQKTFGLAAGWLSVWHWSGYHTTPWLPPWLPVLLKKIFVVTEQCIFWDRNNAATHSLSISTLHSGSFMEPSWQFGCEGRCTHVLTDPASLLLKVSALLSRTSNFGYTFLDCGSTSATLSWEGCFPSVSHRHFCCSHHLC